MPLPTSRNTTYTTDSPVKSADLNDLQDKAIDAWNGRRGNLTENIPLSIGVTSDPADWIATGSAWASQNASPAGILFSLPLCDGDRLREVRASYLFGAGTYCRLSLLYSVLAEAAPFAFTVAIEADGATAGGAELVLTVPDIVIGDESEEPGQDILALYVTFTTDGTSNVLHGLKMVSDHP